MKLGNNLAALGGGLISILLYLVGVSARLLREMHKAGSRLAATWLVSLVSLVSLSRELNSQILVKIDSLNRTTLLVTTGGRVWYACAFFARNYLIELPLGRRVGQSTMSNDVVECCVCRAHSFVPRDYAQTRSFHPTWQGGLLKVSPVAVACPPVSLIDLRHGETLM
jgi:hypothetical protein